MKRIKSISKKVNIYISVFVLLVSAVFSFPMDAKAAKKRFTFTAGENADSFWYLDGTDSQYYPSGPPAGGLMAGVSGKNMWSGYNYPPSYTEAIFADPNVGGELHFYLNENIPANTDLVIEAVVTINCPSGALRYDANDSRYKLAPTLFSPSGSTQSYSVQAISPDVHTLVVKFKCNVHTTVVTNNLKWKNFKFRVFGVAQTKAYNITYNSFTAYYEVDETEQDILEDIRDNTTETNDKLDNLTDGFQNDGMDSSKDELNSSLAGIDNAENSLFNPAKDHLGSYEFVDINSFQGLATGVTFVSTFLQSFYVSSGGLDGLGIITAVGFSVLLVSVVIGFFRYYKK